MTYFAAAKKNIRAAITMVALFLILNGCYWVGHRVELNIVSTPFSGKNSIDRFSSSIIFKAVGYRWKRIVSRRKFGNKEFPKPDQIEYIVGESGRSDHTIRISIFENNTVKVTFGHENAEGVVEEGAWIKALAVSLAPEEVRFKNIRTGEYEKPVEKLPQRPKWPACQARRFEQKCD